MKFYGKQSPIQYADDTQLYFVVPVGFRGAVETMNKCLEALWEWVRASKLKIKPDKMEMLLVKIRSVIGNGSFLAPFGVALPLKIHNLRVLLDPDFLLDKQVAAMARISFSSFSL